MILHIQHGKRFRLAAAAVVAASVMIGAVSASAASAEKSAIASPSPSAAVQEGKVFNGVKQISGGDASAYAVKEDGTAWAWGGGYSSIGNGSTAPAYTPVQLQIDHVRTISGGYRHTLLLKEDGTVWAVGGNEHGQLGNGKQSPKEIAASPVQVAGLSDIIAVAAGDDHSLALRKDGTVWGWGGNEQGQLGDGSRTNQTKPVQVKGLPAIVAISAGRGDSLALGNGGEIWEWGSANAAERLVRKPTLLEGNGEYKAIALNYMHEGAAIRSDGTVWVWMNDENGVIPGTKLLSPVQVQGLSDIVSIAGGSGVKADGTIWQWKWDGGALVVSQVPGIQNAVAVAEGGGSTYVLLQDGTVLAWGWNAFGQSGQGVIGRNVWKPGLVLNSIGVFLNGTEVPMSSPPLIVEGSTYVPLRGIIEKMGLSVSWDVKTRSAIAVYGDTKVVLNSVTGVTTVNGRMIESDQKPIFVNESIFVPLRLISESVGAAVEWDAGTRAVRIQQ
ncbi:RCC1 domain-containing protein [Paenibacillus kobensis]|uniref:RCC1 domain-containing protein n=1 Tax=Paenibacillus kobensis TaxID=59841 RepID=UPI000FD9D8F1|nr:stalk domain-containing protein [Paenibacillus kobensis]